jgi:hypothetical protein
MSGDFFCPGLYLSGFLARSFSFPELTRFSFQPGPPVVRLRIRMAQEIDKGAYPQR